MVLNLGFQAGSMDIHLRGTFLNFVKNVFCKHARIPSGILFCFCFYFYFISVFIMILEKIHYDFTLLYILQKDGRFLIVTEHKNLNICIKEERKERKNSSVFIFDIFEIIRYFIFDIFLIIRYFIFDIYEIVRGP